MYVYMSLLLIVFTPYFIPSRCLQTLVKIAETLSYSILDDSIPCQFLKERPWLFSRPLDAYSRVVVIYALTEFADIAIGLGNDSSKKLQARLDWIVRHETLLFRFHLKYLGFSSLQEHNITVVPKSVKKALNLNIKEAYYSVPRQHFPHVFQSSNIVTYQNTFLVCHKDCVYIPFSIL